MPDSPAEYVAYAADVALVSQPSPLQRAAAEWLNYTAETWAIHNVPDQDHALATARALLGEATP